MSVISNMNGYEALRNAVVMQACEDYVTCKRALATGHTAWGKISNCEKELDECIDFFRGGWYKKLVNIADNPDLNGEKIMKQLDIVAEQGEINPETGDYYKMQGFFESAL